MSESYVHGYRPRESERLHDQAGTLVDLLHAGTVYPSGSSVLEAGCGVGAQTVPLAQRNPEARFTSIDVSANSIAEATRRVALAGLGNVEFRHADIFCPEGIAGDTLQVEHAQDTSAVLQGHGQLATDVRRVGEVVGILVHVRYELRLPGRVGTPYDASAHGLTHCGKSG